jgi:hypothetical protein
VQGGGSNMISVRQIGWERRSGTTSGIQVLVSGRCGLGLVDFELRFARQIMTYPFSFDDDDRGPGGTDVNDGHWLPRNGQKSAPP